MKIWKSFFIVAFLSSTMSSLQAACFTEITATIYECIRMNENQRAADRFCERRHGEGFQAYYTTDACTVELAAASRGEEYEATPDRHDTTPAACMSAEQGQRLGCRYYDYHKAQRYCSENFGTRWVPFIPEGQCTLEKAQEMRGGVDPRELVDGIESAMDEIDVIVNMVDRSVFNSPIGSLFNMIRPNVDDEFYTDTMKLLMAKMNMLKEKLFENSSKDIRFEDTPQTRKFVQISFRYLTALARIYKVYAQVAHKNHLMISTYNYANLEYLNLKIKVDYANEIVARVNYKAKHVDGGKNIIFEISEQEKQTYEYEAIKNPKNQVEYAKLLTFLGIRESLTNFWGIARLSASRISDTPVRTCGRSFLSFRPGRDNKMTNSDAYTDLVNYDLFQNDYANLRDALRNATIVEVNDENIPESWDTYLLNPERASELIVNMLWDNQNIRRELQRNDRNPWGDRDYFQETAQNDAKILFASEALAWRSFSANHFITLVLGGDDLRNKNSLMQRILDASYEIRVKSITEAFLGTYVWISDSNRAVLETSINEYITTHFRRAWENRLKRKLGEVLSDYNNHDVRHYQIREDKIKAATLTATDGALAAHIVGKIRAQQSLNGIKRINPKDMQSLMGYFNARIDQSYFDVRFSMQESTEKKNLVDAFFRSVGQKFMQNIASYVRRLERLQTLDQKLQFYRNYTRQYPDGDYLEGSLRRAAIEAARELYAQYPFTLREYHPRPSQDVYVARSTPEEFDAANFSPIDDQGRPIGVPTAAMDLLVTLAGHSQSYVTGEPTVVDRLSALMGLNRRVFAIPGFEDEQDESRETRNNQDAISTGRIGAPVSVSRTGVIRTTRGTERIDRSTLEHIASQAGLRLRISQARRSTDNNQAPVVYYENRQTHQRLRELPIHQFVYRFLDALNLSFVAARNAGEGMFAPTVEDQMAMASLVLGQVYQAAAILEHQTSWQETYTHIDYSYGSEIRTQRTRTVKGSVLQKIAKDKLDVQTGYLDINGVRAYILSALGTARDNIAGKLEKFCRIDYFNFSNDENFKDIFRASKGLVAQINSPAGNTPQRVEELNQISEAIKQRTRTTWERVDEDYIEPALMVVGAAAIVAFLITVFLSSAGSAAVAAPGVMGFLLAASNTFLAVEFYASFPIVMGSLAARMNIHLIEIPAQLKFQESLGHSQLESNSIVNWNGLRMSQEENSSNRVWTLAMAPLDFIYGGLLARHTYISLGSQGVRAYARLTGEQLRHFSAPPATSIEYESLSELRRRHGLFGAIARATGQATRRIRAYAPRYQAISEEMIRTGSLRAGLVRKAQQVGVNDTPWVLKNEMQNFITALSNRLESYTTYIQREDRLVRRVRTRGRGRLSRREMNAFSREFGESGFYPTILQGALENGDLAQFVRDLGGKWNAIRTLQAHIMRRKKFLFEELLDKLQEVERTYVARGMNRGDAEAMQQFINSLTDEQIVLMREVAKYSRGRSFGEFEQVYRDHERVLNGLRPYEYIVGARAGERFESNIYEPMALLGLHARAAREYHLAEGEDDLRAYYETLISSNLVIGPTDFNRMRSEVESILSARAQ